VGAEADDDGLPVSLDGLPAAHMRVLLDGLPVFERYGHYGLLLAGGYAFRATGPMTLAGDAIRRGPVGCDNVIHRKRVTVKM
jgi:hypothetical protein